MSGMEVEVIIRVHCVGRGTFELSKRSITKEGGHIINNYEKDLRLIAIGLFDNLIRKFADWFEAEAAVINRAGREGREIKFKKHIFEPDRE